jgi:4-hydroxybenzoate polyprenyltransferase
MNILQKLIKSSRATDLMFFAFSISLFGIITSQNYSIFLFLSGLFTIAFIYLFNAYTDFEEDKLNKPIDQLFISPFERKILFIFFSLFLFFALFLSFISSLFAFFFVVIITLLGFFYSFKIFGFRFKQFGFTKTFILSLGWGLLIFVSSPSFNTVNIFAFLSIFIFAFNLGSLSDIKDIEGDLKIGVKTLVSIFSIKKFIFILITIDVLTIMFILFEIYENYLPFYFIFVILTLSFIIGGLIFGLNYEIHRKTHNKFNIKLWLKIIKNGIISIIFCFVLMSISAIIILKFI